MKPWLALAFFALAYFVGLGSMSVVDYDEACYAEVARGMHARGDALVPELNGEPFFEKPPLLYWGQILGYELFGVGEVGARLMNTCAALLTLLAVFLFARRALDARAAFRAMVILGTSFAVLAVGRVALTDMWLTLWIVICLGAAHRALEPDGGLRWLVLAAVASGLAMLTKGAIGVLLPGGALLFYAWSIGALRRLFRPAWIVPCALITLAVGTSWYVMLGLTHAGGFGFMRELFWEHHVERFLDPKHRHEGPIFYYLLVLFVGFQPWTFFIFPSLSRRSWPERGAGQRLLRLFGIFSLLTLVFFSIAATKLPNYATPIYPFLALMVAAALGRPDAEASTRGWRVAGLLTVVGWFVAAAVCFALPYVVSRLPDLADERALKGAPGLAYPLALGATPYVLGGILAAFGVAGLARRWYRNPVRLTWPVAAASVACAVLVVLGVMPRVDAHFFRPLRHVALEAAAAGPHEERVVMVGVRYRPSTLFYGGRLSEYVSIRRTERLEPLFRGPRPRDAITIEPFVERLRGLGPVEIVARDTGYVWVRLGPVSDEDG